MGVFNVARGKIAYYASLPAANDAITIVAFQVAGQVADTVMRDYATLAAIKAANTEATFTGYARKTMTNIHTPGQTGIVPDNSTDTLSIDADDFSWTSAGGTTNNSLGRLVFAYVPDTTVAVNDGTTIPLTFYDYVTATDGTTKQVQVNAAGFWRSQ